MTKEELLLLRKKYNDSIKEKEELIKIKNRILELKEMSEVREYLRLIELFNQKNKSEDKVNKSELYFLERATKELL